MARDSPRETPEAAGRAEGDAPGVEGFAFGASRDTRTRLLPRGGPRETDFAAGQSKGDVSGPESVALAASRGSPHPPNPTKPEGEPG